jgi:hypothetical protein
MVGGLPKFLPLMESVKDVFMERIIKKRLTLVKHGK